MMPSKAPHLTGADGGRQTGKGEAGLVSVKLGARLGLVHLENKQTNGLCVCLPNKTHRHRQRAKYPNRTERNGTKRNIQKYYHFRPLSKLLVATKLIKTMPMLSYLINENSSVLVDNFCPFAPAISLCSCWRRFIMINVGRNEMN